MSDHRNLKDPFIPQWLDEKHTQLYLGDVKLREGMVLSLIEYFEFSTAVTTKLCAVVSHNTVLGQRKMYELGEITHASNSEKICEIWIRDPKIAGNAEAPARWRHYDSVCTIKQPGVGFSWLDSIQTALNSRKHVLKRCLKESALVSLGVKKDSVWAEVGRIWAQVATDKMRKSQ